MDAPARRGRSWAALPPDTLMLVAYHLEDPAPFACTCKAWADALRSYSMLGAWLARHLLHAPQRRFEGIPVIELMAGGGTAPPAFAQQALAQAAQQGQAQHGQAQAAAAAAAAQPPLEQLIGHIMPAAAPFAVLAWCRLAGQPPVVLLRVLIQTLLSAGVALERVEPLRVSLDMALKQSGGGDGRDGSGGSNGNGGSSEAAIDGGSSDTAPARDDGPGARAGPRPPEVLASVELAASLAASLAAAAGQSSAACVATAFAATARMGGQPPALLLPFAAAGGHEALLPVLAAMARMVEGEQLPPQLQAHLPPGPLAAAGMAKGAAFLAEEAFRSFTERFAPAAAAARARRRGSPLLAAAAAAAAARSDDVVLAQFATAVGEAGVVALVCAAAASGDVGVVQAVATALARQGATSVAAANQLALMVAVQRGEAALVRHLFSAREVAPMPPPDRRALARVAPDESYSVLVHPNGAAVLEALLDGELEQRRPQRQLQPAAAAPARRRGNSADGGGDGGGGSRGGLSLAADDLRCLVDMLFMAPAAGGAHARLRAMGAIVRYAARAAPSRLPSLFISAMYTSSTCSIQEVEEIIPALLGMAAEVLRAGDSSGGSNSGGGADSSVDGGGGSRGRTVRDVYSSALVMANDLSSPVIARACCAFAARVGLKLLPAATPATYLSECLRLQRSADHANGVAGDDGSSGGDGGSGGDAQAASSNGGGGEGFVHRMLAEAEAPPPAPPPPPAALLDPSASGPVTRAAARQQDVSERLKPLFVVRDMREACAANGGPGAAAWLAGRELPAWHVATLEALALQPPFVFWLLDFLLLLKPRALAELHARRPERLRDALATCLSMARLEAAGVLAGVLSEEEQARASARATWMQLAAAPDGGRHVAVWAPAAAWVAARSFFPRAISFHQPLLKGIDYGLRMGHAAGAWAIMGGLEAGAAPGGSPLPLLARAAGRGSRALELDGLRPLLLRVTRAEEAGDDDEGGDDDSDSDDDDEREGPAWDAARAAATAAALLPAAGCSGSPWLMLGVANRMRRWLAAAA